MLPLERTEKAASLWSTNDNACAHCRERKIRCGREKPRCANCKRDGVECEWSNPAKRVNHIKLLCRNVGGLEDRLSNVEAELSSMNDFLRTNGNQRPPPEIAIEAEHSGEVSANDPPGEDNSCLSPIDRHLVRSSLSLTDRYHGPCTLLAFCNDFRDILLSAEQIETPNSASDWYQQNQRHNRPAIDVAAKSLLDRICVEVGTEESVDLLANLGPIRLPPKQFLMMAQTQFFLQANYETDIFVQSCFWTNVERVYSRPFTPADEAWAICFNTMILLVLGPGNSTQSCDSLNRSQFVRPFLLTVHSALSNPRALMAAKIVNVQTLALLSIAAQMYYPLEFAESIFAQACVLGRTMGLHQAPSAPEGLGPEEAEERVKVFTSLNLRDKRYLILRGSICWLPSFDCSLSSGLSESGHGNSRHAARIQLAGLQDESYRLLHSADSSRRSSAKFKNSLLRLEQSLGHWANASELFSSAYASSRDINLQLEFLAVRICVFRKSDEPSHTRQALVDSRASCLLVLISCGKHESSMIEQLDNLLLSISPTSRRSSRSGKACSPESPTRATSESNPSRYHSLLDSFSAPAFFLLATNVIRPSSAYDESKAEEDLHLLQRTSACYRELDVGIQANNYTRKVGRAFERLLEVANLVKTSHQFYAPHIAMQRSQNTHNMLSASRPFGEQHLLSKYSNLPTLTTSSTSPVLWASFSNTHSSTTTQSSPRSSASPILLTSTDLQFQPFDPRQQSLFFPHTQQQNMQPPNSNRQHANQSDVAMDYFADARSLSEFAATNPSMTF